MYQYVRKAQFYINLHTIVRKARVYNQFAERVFTIAFIQFIQILVLYFSSFLFRP